MDEKSFPRNKIEALALIYAEKTATADTTPEQLLEAYEDAFKRITKREKELYPRPKQTMGY